MHDEVLLGRTRQRRAGMGMKYYRSALFKSFKEFFSSLPVETSWLINLLLLEKWSVSLAIVSPQSLLQMLIPFPCMLVSFILASLGSHFPKRFESQSPMDFLCEIYDILWPRLWNLKSYHDFKFHFSVFCLVLEYTLKKSSSLHWHYLCSEVQSNATWFLIFLSNLCKAVHYCTMHIVGSYKPGYLCVLLLIMNIIKTERN